MLFGLLPLGWVGDVVELPLDVCDKNVVVGSEDLIVDRSAGGAEAVRGTGVCLGDVRWESGGQMG